MFGNIKNQSFIFWPVGSGDATTVVVAEGSILQIDINDTVSAEDPDNERMEVVDELEKSLPKRGKKPYLACFALTHPDLDHVRGFADLLKRVHIGEIWFTPRVFWEYTKDLSPDAQAFKKEAKRRVKVTIDAEGADIQSGDRVRIIGYDDLLQKDDYAGFPPHLLTIPGHTVTMLDGKELAESFTAFFHAPFKDDSAAERNETSLAMQIELKNGFAKAAGLFLGDLSHPTLMRIFRETHNHGNEPSIQWDVLLAPHHCSKKVMYQDEDGKEVLKQDILDEFMNSQRRGGWIVASSAPFPERNSPGDNPPHLKARARYEEIAFGGFKCTGEFSSPDGMRALVFTLDPNGTFAPDDDGLPMTVEDSLTASVAAARGTQSPPATKVGFGTR